MNGTSSPRQLANELILLNELVPLQAQRIVELGCGNARLSRDLVQQFPQCHVTALEVDRIQHVANMAHPAERLEFVEAGAQAIPAPDASFDLAIMLKSLHHVPLAVMDQALSEIERVLKPGACWYVSEPVYAGALNEVVRLFNDEGTVRAAAQALVDKAAANGHWDRVSDVYFDVPVSYRDFADFERRMVDVTYADRRFDEATRARVQAIFEPHMTAEGAFFVRPMHVTLLRRGGRNALA